MGVIYHSIHLACFCNLFSSKMKEKLDRIFSKYIRLRDANDYGIVKCYCCGKLLHWKKSQNMHFIPRQHMATRFDEVNCHAGCVKCNYYDNGNIEQYTLHLKKDYGDDIVERLVLKKNQGRKFSKFEYQELIKHYTNEVKKLSYKDIQI